MAPDVFILLPMNHVSHRCRVTNSFHSSYKRVSKAGITVKYVGNFDASEFCACLSAKKSQHCKI